MEKLVLEKRKPFEKWFAIITFSLFIIAVLYAAYKQFFASKKVPGPWNELFGTFLIITIFVNSFEIRRIMRSAFKNYNQGEDGVL